MKKMMSVLLTVLLFACSFVCNVFAEDGNLYAYESQVNETLTANGYALSKVSGNIGWAYFGLDSTFESDIVNEIKIEKYNVDKYEDLIVEKDINVSITRVKQDTTITVTLTPNSSSIFSSIVITKEEGSDATAIINNIYNSDDSTKYRISVKFGLPPEGGGQDDGPGQAEQNDVFRFTYNNVEYVLGFGNGSSDGTMHIDGGSQVDLSKGEAEFVSHVLIGIVNDKGQVSEPANSDIYSLFNTFNYSVEGEDIGGIVINTSSDTMFGATTDKIVTTIDRSAPTNARIHVTFKFSFDDGVTTEDGEFFFNVDCVKTVEREKTLSEDNPVSQLNTILSDDAKLKEFFGVESFDENDELIIKFPQGSYEGVITCNYESEHDSLGLIIDGNGSSLTGGIISNGGITGIKNFNLKASDSYKAEYNNNDYKIGLLLDDKTTSVVSNRDIDSVKDCSFEGFDYGIISSGNSLISGVNNCTFKQCSTGIYENSSNNNYYSDSGNDTFVNCDIGIEIVSVPRNNNPYQFVFRNMYFFNDSTSYCDYKVDCEGKFFYTKNYYGITYTDGADNITDANIRSAKISYLDAGKTKVYTNPCIRYPDNDDKLGIDPATGLFTGVVVGGEEKNSINTNDLANNSIDLCASGSGNQLGVLSFGGNE